MMPTKKKSPVAAVLRDAIGRRQQDPRLAEIAYMFIHAAGGPEGFAKELWSEYNKSPTGGIARQRILDMVLRCLKVANEQDPKGSTDAGLLSDEDLQRHLDKVLDATQEEAKS